MEYLSISEREGFQALVAATRRMLQDADSWLKTNDIIREIGLTSDEWLEVRAHLMTEIEDHHGIHIPRIRLLKHRRSEVAPKREFNGWRSGEADSVKVAEGDLG